MPSWSMTDLRRSSQQSSCNPVYIDEVIVDHRIQQLNTGALSRQYRHLKSGCVKASLSDSVIPSSEGSQTSSCNLVHDCCVGNPTITRCVPGVRSEEMSRRKKRSSLVMKSPIPSTGYGFGEFRGTMSLLTDNNHRRSHAFQMFPHVGYEANCRRAHSKRRYARSHRTNYSVVCAAIRKEAESLNEVQKPETRRASDELDAPVDFEKRRRVARCPKV